MNNDWLMKSIFAVGWQQHGGSGLTFNRQDMLDMSPAELTRHAREAHNQRKREADAVKASYKAKK